MDFGQVNFNLSSNLTNSVITFTSLNNVDRVYRYSKKSVRVLADGSTNEYWECMDCKKIKRQRGTEENELYSSITVCSNRFRKDPDVGHHRDCEGESFGKSNAKILVREARNLCKLGHKRPLEANTSMNSQIVRRYRNANESEAVETNLPEYRSVKSSFRRWFRQGRIPVEDPYDLPAEYQVNAKFSSFIL